LNVAHLIRVFRNLQKCANTNTAADTTYQRASKFLEPIDSNERALNQYPRLSSGQINGKCPIEILVVKYNVHNPSFASTIKIVNVQLHSLNLRSYREFGVGFGCKATIICGGYKKARFLYGWHIILALQPISTEIAQEM
jgi:hypothetical protein